MLAVVAPAERWKDVTAARDGIDQDRGARSQHSMRSETFWESPPTWLYSLSAFEVFERTRPDVRLTIGLVFPHTVAFLNAPDNTNQKVPGSSGSTVPAGAMSVCADC